MRSEIHLLKLETILKFHERSEKKIRVGKEIVLFKSRVQIIIPIKYQKKQPKPNPFFPPKECCELFCFLFFFFS